jgi:hypothetical protein
VLVEELELREREVLVGDEGREEVREVEGERPVCLGPATEVGEWCISVGGRQAYPPKPHRELCLKTCEVALCGGPVWSRKTKKVTEAVPSAIVKGVKGIIPVL